MSLYLFLCHLAIISRFIWYRTTQSHPPIPSLRSTCTPLLSLPLYSSLLIPPLAPPPHSSLKSPSFHCSSISVLDPSSTGPRRLTSPLNSLRLYFLFIPSIPLSHQSSSPHPQCKLRITSCLRATPLSFCLVIRTRDLCVYWVHLRDRNSIFMFRGFYNESNVRLL